MRTKQSARMHARKRSLGVPPLATLNPKRHQPKAGKKTKKEVADEELKWRNGQGRKQRTIDCKERQTSPASLEAAANKYLKQPLKDVPKEGLKALAAAVANELKSRNSLHEMIASLRKSYADIDWGYGDWKSEKTSDAVSRLCRLRSSEKKIGKAILALDDDVEGQWKAALSFSLELARMIGTAEDYAGKLVNGSMGEWCPDTAVSVESLWEELIAKEERPSGELISEVCEKLEGCLGDYENNLQKLLAEIAD